MWRLQGNNQAGQSNFVFSEILLESRAPLVHSGQVHGEARESAEGSTAVGLGDSIRDLELSRSCKPHAHLVVSALLGVPLRTRKGLTSTLKSPQCVNLRPPLGAYRD